MISDAMYSVLDIFFTGFLLGAIVAFVMMTTYLYSRKYRK